MDLLSLLAKHKANVFCGHIHHTTFTRYRSEEGEITQTSLFSQVPPNPPKFEILSEGDGNAYFSQKAIAAALETQNAAGKLIQEYQGKIVEYAAFGPAAGFVIVDIDKGIKVNLHQRGAKEADHSITIR